MTEELALLAQGQWHRGKQQGEEFFRETKIFYMDSGCKLRRNKFKLEIRKQVLTLEQVHFGIFSS